MMVSQLGQGAIPPGSAH